MAELAQYRGTGKRKTSVARVILRPGDGTTWVNGRSLEDYFPRATLRKLALSPLEVLARGYAVCYAVPGDAILKAAVESRVGDRVRVRLHRGRLTCEVKEVDDVAPDETL